MIDIKKDSRVLRVSKCAYEDTFKKLGYKIIDNSVEVAPKTTSTRKIKEEQKLIEEEQKNNKEKDETITSDDLKVNVIGENIKNFDEGKEEQKENSILEKVLQQKENKSKGK